VTARVVRQHADVCLGEAALDVGELTFVRDGRREYSSFAYRRGWLTSPDRFTLSPDLPLGEARTVRRAPSPDESPFPGALADTEPDAWGRRVIGRAHARRRQQQPGIPPLTRFDYLAAVDDASRVGALRLRDGRGEFLRAAPEHRTPQLLDLGRVYDSARKVEQGTETEADLGYLLGKATSLGGLRPKCTLLDVDGHLAIGKFPSIGDSRSITRGEVLALQLARRAGLGAAEARIEVLEGVPVAVIRRFDRTTAGARIHYLSAGSLLQARRDEDRAYTEVADVLRSIGSQPVPDLAELWRRLLFNLLISNVDDHLWNLGVLYAGNTQWALAPAFDLNPFPERERESKTWLSEDTGPITSLDMLLDGAAYFGIGRPDAEAAAASMALVLRGWRDVATSREVGLRESELRDFAPAFEHDATRAALALGGY
jgi:serine/threonine-protein kinase HipA